MQNYSIDFIAPIRKLIYFLMVVGLWPINSIHFSWFNKVYTLIFQFIFTFAYTSFKCINFIYLTDLDIITRAMFICLTEIALIVKILNFYFRIEMMQDCLASIKQFQLLNKEEVELFNAKLVFLSRIITWYLSVTNITAVFSYMTPWFVAEPILPYPAWYPLDWSHHSLHYWIAYVYQVVGMFFQAHSLVILEVYFIFLMVSISTQFEVLSKRLERIGYYNGDDCMLLIEKNAEAENILSECIRIHSVILKYV